MFTQKAWLWFKGRQSVPAPASGKPRIFVSYAHADAIELATKLHRNLTIAGYEVWLDVERLKGGANWSSDIEAALERADVVLALLSDAAYHSDVCRGEQLRSLRYGKCVIPVLVQARTDRPVYLESKQYRDFSSPASFKHNFQLLLRDINTRAGASLSNYYRHTDYETVPPLPETYLERNRTLAMIRHALLADRTNRQTGVAGIQGMGGVGKTVLAQATCLDPVVQAAFPDGIAWVTIGQNPGNLIPHIQQIAKALGESTNGFDTPEESQSRLRAILGKKASLIVLDDVWNFRHVEPFRANAARCRILFTTRDSRVATILGAPEVSLDLLDNEESRLLLAHYARRECSHLPACAADLLQYCGGLALALAMLGSLLRGKQDDRWFSLAEELRATSTQSIHAELAGYPYPSLANAMQVSLANLDPELRERYEGLAVFRQDISIPLAALTVFWSATFAQVQRIADRLVELSLASRDSQSRLVLHTLQRESLTGCAHYAVLNEKLLSAYSTYCVGNWHRGPDDGYFFQFLPYHLFTAGRFRELDELLFTFDWLQAKLEAVGAIGLITDFDLLPETPDAKSIQEAIRLAAHVIATDIHQLAGQLIGRLSHSQSHGMRNLVGSAANWRGKVWFRPILTGLAPSGGPLIRTINANSEALNAVAIFPDRYWAVCGSSDCTLTLWNLDTAENIRTLRGHEDEVTAVAVSADGQWIVSGSRDHTVRIWNFETGEQLRILRGHKDRVTNVRLTADGQFVVSGSLDRTVRIWDFKTGKQVRALRGHKGHVTGVRLTADGRFVVSGSSDRTVRIWDFKTGEQIQKLQDRYKDPITAVTVTSDGKFVFSRSLGGMITRFSIYASDKTRTVRGPSLTSHLDFESMLELTPDDRNLIFEHGDAIQKYSLKFLSIEQLEEVRTLRHDVKVTAVEVAPDGRRAVSVSKDGMLRYWNLRSSCQIDSFRENDRHVTALVITSDGRWVVSGSSDDVAAMAHKVPVKVWEFHTGREIRTLSVPLIESCWLTISLVTAAGARPAILQGHGRVLKLSDLETGQEIRELIGHEDSIVAVAATPDSKWAISGARDRTLRLWNLKTGDQVCKIVQHETVSAVAITSDSELAIVEGGYQDNSLRLWNLRMGSEISAVSKAPYDRRLAAVSPDNRRAILTFKPRTRTFLTTEPLSIARFEMWDLNAGNIVGLAGHETDVTTAAFTYDGRRMISADAGGTLILWDMETIEVVHIVGRHGKRVNSVAVTPDGKQAISVSHDQTLKLWALDSATLCATFTADEILLSCSLSRDGRNIAVGGTRNIHFFQLEGLEE